MSFLRNFGPRHCFSFGTSVLRTYRTSAAINCEKVELTHREKNILKRKQKEERRKEHLQNRERKLKKANNENTFIKVETLADGKKDTSCPLPDAYSPLYVESAWYEWWEKSGFFRPKKKEGAERFVICLPPPNVTGTLHLGHALGCSIQDALIRWHQMKGHEVVWIPGSDHAGIATQVVVERRLWRERRATRHDIGREKFTEEVWKWKQEKGNIIYEQLRRLGCCLDWSRDYFTLDEKMSTAVKEAFIRLHEEGLIYRDKRLVNWSCALCSAISDIEVDNLELEKRTNISVPGYDKPVTFGTMTHFLYPVHQSEEKLEIATTRLETMLGDVAVAVHPDDRRYTHLHGNHVQHPIRGDSIPIICDTSVDMNFGTGVVKITPGHDQNDYEMGKRHNLPIMTVIDDHGNMTNVPHEYMGMKRYDCRQVLESQLSGKALLKEIKDHTLSLPICSRSGDVVEPLVKDQWFVDLRDMGKEAAMAPGNGDLEIIPEHRLPIYNEWFKNLRDWCISRQLWWGHQIPAFRVTRTDGKPLDGFHGNASTCWVSGHSLAEAREKASRQLGVDAHLLHLQQDEDVLDTWFSSALIPFAMFGWPQQTEDLSRYYPTTTLETATDILFFWVARMIMFGKKMTGKFPFEQVLLHGIVRDGKGQKMSKSLGNVIDPLHVINGISLQNLKDGVKKSNMDQKEIKSSLKTLEKEFPHGIPQCGSDALRFSLCSYNYKADNINVDISHIHAHRKFCNKIWQAFKLCNSIWDKHAYREYEPLKTDSFVGLDAWILSRLSEMVANCDVGFRQLSLNHATEAIYQFFWLEFCDIYLTAKNLLPRSCEVSWETSVETLNETLTILYTCMDTNLRCITPFMPYLSEELYQRLPRLQPPKPLSICLAEYPQPHQYPWKNDHVEAQFDLAFRVINAIRSLRTDFAFTKTKADVIFASSCSNDLDAMKQFLPESTILSRSNAITMATNVEASLQGYATSPINDNTVIHFKLQGNVEKSLLIDTFSKKLSRLEGDYALLQHAGDTENSANKLKSLKEDMKYKQHCLRLLQSLD